MEIAQVSSSIPHPSGRETASGEPPAEGFGMLLAAALGPAGTAEEAPAEPADEAGPSDPLAAAEIRADAAVVAAMASSAVAVQAAASAAQFPGSLGRGPTRGDSWTSSDPQMLPDRGAGGAVSLAIISSAPSGPPQASSLSQKDLLQENVDGSRSPRLRAAAERLWGFWVRSGAVPDPRGATGGGDESALTWADTVRGDGSAAGESPNQSAPELAASVRRGFVSAKAANAETGSSPSNETPAPDVAPLAKADAKLPPEQPWGSRPAAPLGPPAQAAQAVRVCFARGGDQVTVHLEPESLGKIDVYLARESGGVEAHFRVEKPETFHALQAELPLLRHALESRGVPLTHVFLEQESGEERGPDPWGWRWERRGRRSRVESAELGGAQGVGQPTLYARPWGFETRI